MLGFIFLLMSILFIFTGLLWVFHDIEKRDAGFGMFAGSIIVSFVAILNISAIDLHIKDLSKLRYSAQYIQIRQNAINDIDRQLSDINITQGLLNSDLPVSSFIQAKADYIKDMVNTKEEILNIKVRIEARKNGSESWIVWIWGSK